jgi:hypothetical protein
MRTQVLELVLLDKEIMVAKGLWQLQIHTGVAGVDLAPLGKTHPVLKAEMVALGHLVLYQVLL